MDLSFYIAAVGANAQQTRLNTIANNLANVQTEGYKTQSTGFVDLLYNNYYTGGSEEPETGSGAKALKTDILFEQGGMMTTDAQYDFAISGDGFFAVYDRGSQQVYYTRNGHFNMANYGNNVFYLTTNEGYLLMNKDAELISIDPQNKDEALNIGVFDFDNKEGFLLKGGNYFEATEKNGGPYLKEDAVIEQGRLEMANVDMAYEMSRLIETQRAYQMTLKMIQTSDDVEQTINNLR